MKKITFFILIVQKILCKETEMLRFQLNNGRKYSIEEYAEFKGKIPHLNAFTVCHWERLKFFVVRDTCPWAFCYKNTDDFKDHQCTQFWYNRDLDSGGRYVKVAGGFGDNSYGGEYIILLL